MRRPHTVLLLAVVLTTASAGSAGYKTPPPPAEYQVTLRYTIPSPRDQHVVYYDALVKYLKKVGLKFDPGPDEDREDSTKNILTGTIAPAKAQKLLGNPSVAAVLLLPAKYVVPARPTDPVKVRVQLVSGFPLHRQRILSDQTATLLEDLGFQEAIAYDHKDFTRLVGWIPAGSLPALLKDIRTQPSGWLAPAIPLKVLPAPLKTVSPVLITEVIPEPATVPPVQPLPKFEPPQKELEKVGRPLRALLGAARANGKPLRLEIILATVPDENDRGWRLALEETAPSLRIEGRLGPLVTALVSPADVPALARLPAVSVVRLPRPARPQVFPARGSPADNARTLRALGMHRLAVPRRGVRVAVIDGDFRGFEELVKKGLLPANARAIDLTAGRNRDLRPDPFPGDPQEISHGSRCALALATAMAGSGVDFVLVRVDPAAPYQLQEVARYLHGERPRSDVLDLRQAELDGDRRELRQARASLNEERKRVLDNLREDEETVARRKAYFKKEKVLDQAEEELRQREVRYVALLRSLAGLKGTQIVSSSLVWPDGYPVDGGSALSRYFDDRPFRSALWFQSAGNTRGQAWSGLFRDRDGNGVMEFAPPETKLPEGRWTHELNFLGWQPFGKKQVPELPAGAKLRFSVQWREPHDPGFLRRGEDLYREPLARVRLVLLRQRDPEGKDLPADDMEEVARSPGYADRYGLPQRLVNEPAFAVYEQTLEYTIPRAGRYALRLEGKAPPGIRPPSVPTLPAQVKSWELRPRIFVQAEDEASRNRGRPVFLDYATDQGALGMPADARRVITVGSADRTRKPARYSAHGPAMNLEMRDKPNLLLEDDGRLGTEGSLAYGTSLAAPLAAGLAARAIASGASSVEYWRGLQGRPARVLRLPPR